MTTHTPIISVVICTYNRDRFIGKSLQCLNQQTLDKAHYEVIVVDNNSTDSTAAICKNFIEQHDKNVFRYVFEPQKGLSFARNRGIQEARGSIITYVDDDAEAVPGFLESIYHFMRQNTDAAGIGGRVKPLYEKDREPEWMNKYLKGFVGEVDFGSAPLLFTKGMKFPAGCNMTYRKEMLQEVGGFNNQLTFRSDDKYIFYQVKNHSGKVYYLPDAMVYHNIDNHRLTFDNFKKLFLKTGNEEKKRVQSEGTTFGLIKKFIEYLVKFGASLLLYIKYLITGNEVKGRYIVYSQWFTLRGFLMKSVFVR